ncbi:hypothetical protein Droror1_Dr00017360 [Drosera rotundifolia]
MIGSFNDSAIIAEFSKRCDIVTTEIEHVDVATLKKLEEQGVDCQPKASTIRIIQVLFFFQLGGLVDETFLILESWFESTFWLNRIGEKFIMKSNGVQDREMI